MPSRTCWYGTSQARCVQRTWCWESAPVAAKAHGPALGMEHGPARMEKPCVKLGNEIRVSSLLVPVLEFQIAMNTEAHVNIWEELVVWWWEIFISDVRSLWVGGVRKGLHLKVDKNSTLETMLRKVWCLDNRKDHSLRFWINAKWQAFPYLTKKV